MEEKEPKGVIEERRSEIGDREIERKKREKGMG